MLIFQTCTRNLLITLFIGGFNHLVPAQTDPPEIMTHRVQEKLKRGEILLEYKLTDSLLNIYAVTETECSFTELTLAPAFWSALSDFKKSLRSADFDGFFSPGLTLYTFLIRPVKKMLTGKKRMIVIPGQDLSGLPFEAFIRCNNSLRPFSGLNMRYLIQDYEIIYHFTIGQWVENLFTSSKTDIEFLGFSPVFSHHPELNPLPYSKKEVVAIGALFKKKGRTSKVIYDRLSEKEYFKTVAGRGRIVHVATHYLPQIINHACSGLLFAGDETVMDPEICPNEVLTREEISNLKLNADLVVLNACSTGAMFPNSNMAQQSFPMSFLLAGAHNVIYSCWNITDALANRFMVDFYRRCLSGKTYSQALREVKLNMIRIPETSLPTVWAPYLLAGQ